MAVIKPFRALRPTKKLADQIAALPYDVMDSKEAQQMVEDNPHSFLRIDRAEINFPEILNPHDPRVYQKAKELLDTMVDKEYFIQDNKDSLYIYRQIMNGRPQTGLVVTTSIDDYLTDKIKKHEYTLPEKEQDRMDHIKALQAQTGPIFQTYRDKPEITDIITNWTKNHQPEYEFSIPNVKHIIWVVDCPKTITQLVKLFKQVDHLYIADGHHRSKAAVEVGLEMRKKYLQLAETGAFNYFLAVLFPASDLKIWPYYRVVKDLAGATETEFLEKLKENFQVTKAPKSPYEPQTKGAFGMFLGEQWYKLVPKDDLVQTADPVKRLDAAILQNHLLDPILNIKDPRTDTRIDFVGGIRGVKELERRVNTDMEVAFSLYPTAIEEVINVADEGKVMPPKSTWFEPKLLSGLFIHKLT